MKVIILAIVALLALVIYRKVQKIRRERFLEHYSFPKSIPDKLLKHYPHLNAEQLDRVMYGLREYFAICNTAGKRMISMPSQVVDMAWHEFILFTRSYEEFCQQGLGRFLHHTPAEAMSTPQIAQDGIKRAWLCPACAKVLIRKIHWCCLLCLHWILNYLFPMASNMS